MLVDPTDGEQGGIRWGWGTGVTDVCEKRRNRVKRGVTVYNTLYSTL